MHSNVWPSGFSVLFAILSAEPTVYTARKHATLHESVDLREQPTTPSPAKRLLPLAEQVELLSSETTSGFPSVKAGGALASLAKPGLAEAFRLQVSEAYGKLPVSFEANRGQADRQVKFLARGPHGTLFLTGAEAVVVATRRDAPARVHAAPREPLEGEPATAAVLRISFVGGNRTPRVTGLEELPGKANYFVGANPSGWRTNVPTYAKVRYEEVYPGVDVVYYGNHRQLEYDFVVRAGADPNRIVLGFKGADRLELDAEGDLILHTAAGAIRQRKPVVYQEFDGVKKELPGAYVLKGRKHVGFWVAAYNTSRPLVIDPVLIYSTYLGGANTFAAGFGIAVDGSGNAYVAGDTGLSTNFPTTAGAFQTTFGGSSDAFVTKLNSTGSALVYSTYLGGNGLDVARGIAVDGLGNAYVTGAARSTNFPTTAGAFQTTFGGVEDAFVTKLNSTGSALVYSTYLGGNATEFAVAIAVDGSGNSYVMGITRSTNFPTTAGAFQTTFGGGLSDAFVTKLNATGSAPVYSTYLGGNSDELTAPLLAIGGIAVDGFGNAYVTGDTASTNFPTTAGAFQTTFGGGADAFVTKLNSTGSALVYSTYLGGNSGDDAGGIAVDGSGNAYVTGSTASTNFPTTAGAFQTSVGGSFSDAFVTKLNSTGSAVVYSTYLGGGNQDNGLGIAVDGFGNAYVTGLTFSTNFPTTAGAFQTTFGGGMTDAFVTKLNCTGSALVYSTYLGGNSTDLAGGIAVDGSGNAYVTGGTGSTNFPTTAGAFQATPPPFFRFFPGAGFVAKFALGSSGYEIVSRTVSVPPSSVAAVNVACSSGNKVLGGGFSIETAVSVKLFSAAPSDGLGNVSDHQWNVDVLNTHPTNAQQVTAVAICASACLLAGHEIIVNRQLLVPASGVTNVNVTCSGANKVLGGGFSIETPDFVKLFSTEPSDGLGNLSDHQWNVAAQNNDPSGARQVTAVGVCASATAVAGYQIVSNSSFIPASFGGNANVACASGNKVLGGGFLLGTGTPGLVKLLSSEPDDGLGTLSDHRWNVLAQNTDPNSAQQVTVRAICASF